MQRHQNLMKVFVFGIFFLLLGTNFFPFISAKGNQSKTASNIIVVDNEGDGDYQTIQEAIEHAEAGDTIRVYSGTYIENIAINKQLILDGIASEYQSGNDTGKPIINGRASTTLVSITAENTSFSGFSIMGNITNGNNIGINLDDSSGTIIASNDVTNCSIGLFANSTKISQMRTYGVNFSKNNISNCNEGMYIKMNEDSIVFKNRIAHVDYGIVLIDVVNCKVYNNIIIGKKLTPYFSAGIRIIQGLNIEVYENLIENCNCGIALSSCNLWMRNIKLFNLPIFHKIVSHPNIIPKNGNELRDIDSKGISLNRKINIYHNNFMFNSNNAYFEYVTSPLRRSLLFEIFIILLYHEVAYPTLLTRNHFYENYWSDIPGASQYEINGRWFSSRPLMILYYIILNGPLIWLLDGGFYIKIIDIHPLNQPYNISGET